VVQVHSGLPNLHGKFEEVLTTCYGAIAQLGERLLCTQEVCGSIPHSSTISVVIKLKILQSVPEKVHCEVLLFKNLDQAEN
jgi:hypothetical protein